jgi:Na+-transporting NADH:ubiquinone oxidoreductase subunit NqrF
MKRDEYLKLRAYNAVLHTQTELQQHMRLATWNKITQYIQKELAENKFKTHILNNYYSVGFTVLTAVVMKSSIFGDIRTCTPLKVNRHFGGPCRLQLQGRSQARNYRED